MTLPGIVVDTLEDRSSVDATTATDQYFCVAPFLKGPIVPTRISAIEKLQSQFGLSANYTVGPDDAEAYLREGGKNLIVKRVTGSTPVRASATLNNSSAQPVLVVSAKDYGAYGNDLTVQTALGVGSGTFVLTIASLLTATVLEVSPDLADQAAAVAWGATAVNVNVAVSTGTGDPAVHAAQTMTGGTDDHASITDADYTTAAATLDKRMGPGQVAFPGRTTTASHDVLDAHCLEFDRIAVKHLVDTTVAGTLVGAVSSDHVKDGAKKGGVFAPWLIAPDGREIPPCGGVAAKMATIDLVTGNPNEPAAGINGQFNWITGLTADYNDIDREALNDAGVNIIHDVTGLGTLQIYGYRTLVDEDTDPLNIGLNNVRLDMFIRAQARKLGRSLLFDEIDAKGHLVSRYHVLLEALMSDLFTLGAVFGYEVDTDSVNDKDTAAAKTINARLLVQRSPFAEVVVLQVINHAITEEL